MSLDALFEGEDSLDEDTTAEVESGLDEEAQADADDQQETEAPKEPEGETAKPNDDDESSWTKAAYLDEKRKRQDFERRYRELESQLNSANAAPKPSLFENPDAVLDDVKYELRSNLSREFMLELKPDYAEREKQFIELAQNNPALVDQLKQSQNPAKFAYDTAKQAEWLREVSDREAYEAKVEAKLREKILAELKTVPHKPSLAKTTSVSDSIDESDNSLTAILGR